VSPGIQEVVALAIVIAVVGFGLYRRWRKGKGKSASCAAQPVTENDEKTVHFYRRDSHRE
jgi:hypothetical protein